VIALVERHLRVELAGPHLGVDEVDRTGADFERRHREPQALACEESDGGKRRRSVCDATGAGWIGGAFARAPVRGLGIDRGRRVIDGELEAAEPERVGRRDHVRREHDAEL
jgi:hypothetical protein